MRRTSIAAIVGITCALGLAPVASAQQVPQGVLPAAEWVALPLARLAKERGGFLSSTGLQASFGFERLVHVNGELVSALRVRVSDLGRVTPDEARQLQQLARGELIQIGSGNHAAVIPGGLVIQNSLDGQHIQVRTTLDAGVNTLGMMRALQAGAALNTAVSTATGGL